MDVSFEMGRSDFCTEFSRLESRLSESDFAQGRNSTNHNIGVEKTPSYTR